MQGIAGAGLMLLQDNLGQLNGDVHLIMIYIGILAITVLVLGLGLVIGGIVVAVMVGRAVEAAEKVRRRAEPLLDKAEALVEEFVPKVRVISDNVEHISTVARAKADEIGETVSKVNQTVQQVNQTVQEANGRARSQVARADTMVTDALTATRDLTHKVQHGIQIPVRQVAGIVAAVKAGLETLIERSPFRAGGGFGSRQAGPRQAAPRSTVSPVDGEPYGHVPRDPARPYDV